MSSTKQRSGDSAEQFAARYLERQGLTIIERNYRCRGGEIDLIARDGPTLVFIEVRFRRSQTFGGARASIDTHKQRRILLAARHYLSGRREQACRCDVVLLDRLESDGIEWIRNAFGE
jgi:putative endonuclease